MMPPRDFLPFSTLPGQKAVPDALLLQSAGTVQSSVEEGRRSGPQQLFKESTDSYSVIDVQVFQISAFLKPQLSGWAK